MKGAFGILVLFVVAPRCYRKYVNAELMEAIWTNDAAGVKAALADGADPNVKGWPHRGPASDMWPFGDTDWDHRSALALAVSNHNKEIVHILRSHGADGFDEAIATYFDPSIRNFFETRVDPNSLALDDAIRVAAKNGDAKEIISLLNRGADVNARDQDGRTPLMFAIENNWTQAISVLLSRGADANAKTFAGESVVAHAANVNAPRPTIEMLLKAGTKINAPDASRYGTALMDAINYPHWEAVTVTFLLQHGADVNGHDKNGRTALMFAAGGRDSETSDLHLARLLISKGANVNARTKYGETALMDAARHGNVKIVRLLLNRGANPNVATTADNPWNSLPGSAGATALMYAARYGNGAGVKALLESGANPRARTADGRTALDMARESGRADIVKLLQAGAPKRRAR